MPDHIRKSDEELRALNALIESGAGHEEIPDGVSWLDLADAANLPAETSGSEGDTHAR